MVSLNNVQSPARYHEVFQLLLTMLSSSRQKRYHVKEHLVNIAIRIVGLGLVAMAIYCLYTYMTQYHSLFASDPANDGYGGYYFAGAAIGNICGFSLLSKKLPSR